MQLVDKKEKSGRAKKKRKPRGLGSTFKRGSSFVAQVQDGYLENGKPRYKQERYKTEKEAVAALKRMNTLKDQGKSLGGKTGFTVESWIDYWLDEFVKPAREDATYKVYKAYIDKVKPYIGKLELQKLSPDHLRSMFKSLKKAKASSNTIHAVRRNLRNALNVAVKLGYLHDNPVVKTFSENVKRKPKVFFTAEQVKTLFEHLEGSPIENLVKFTLATGVRSGEARGITWKDLNLESGYVLLQYQLQRIDKKLVLKSLKTEKSQRMLPLIGHSLFAVESEKVRQETERLENELDLVFTNPWGRPFDAKYVSEHLHDILEKAELPKTGLHSLRHSAATFMLMNGQNLHVVSRFLGHSQVGLTSNLYGHVLDSGMREAAEKLQEQYC